MSLLLLFFTAGEAPPGDPDAEIYGTSTFLPVSSGLISLTPETQASISVAPETQGEIRVHPA